MRSLYESILDTEDVIVQKTDKVAAQLAAISDCGLSDIMVPRGGYNPKQLNPVTDYTSLFAPIVRSNKSEFGKNSKVYSYLAAQVINMLLAIKSQGKDIYVWDIYSTGPRPDGLIYMEQVFKKRLNMDVQINCQDKNATQIMLELYDNKLGKFIYFVFDENKFEKYIY